MANGEVQFTVKELVMQLHKRIDKVLEGQQEMRDALVQKADRSAVKELEDRLAEVQARQVSEDTLNEFRNRLKRNSIAFWSFVVMLLALLADVGAKVIKK